MAKALRRVVRSKGRVCYLVDENEYTLISEGIDWGKKQRGMPKIGKDTDYSYTSVRPAGLQVCGAYAREWAAWARREVGRL
jgi:hypothetical protein